MATTKQHGAYVVVYRMKGKREQYSFRKIAGNGENVGRPSGNYKHRRSARKAAKREHPGLRLVTQ
jgi:hypothetical protein